MAEMPEVKRVSTRRVTGHTRLPLAERIHTRHTM